MTRGTSAAITVRLLGDGSPDELDGALGAERAATVRALRVARAREWAVRAFGADAFTARDAGAAGALVLVAPVLAAWRADVAVAALEDLRAGCAVCSGPVFDGGVYVLAVAGPHRGLVEDLDLRGRRIMEELFSLAAREGTQVGLLRTERGLRTAGDVAALRADPLCDAELRTALG